MLAPVSKSCPLTRSLPAPPMTPSMPSSVSMPLRPLVWGWLTPALPPARAMTIRCAAVLAL